MALSDKYYSEAVPASWFTGSLYILDSPKKYGNIAVSSDATESHIKEGVFHNHKGGISHSQNGGRLIRDIQFKLVYPNVMHDGYWLLGYDFLEMLLFQYHVNCLYKANKKHKKIGFEFTLLLYRDADGKLYVEPMLPESLHEKDKESIASLKEAIKELPTNIFGNFLTTDGRVFPGKYVRADLTNGIWQFRDYFIDSQLRNVILNHKY